MTNVVKRGGSQKSGLRGYGFIQNQVVYLRIYIY